MTNYTIRWKEVLDEYDFKNFFLMKHEVIKSKTDWTFAAIIESINEPKLWYSIAFRTESPEDLFNNEKAITLLKGRIAEKLKGVNEK